MRMARSGRMRIESILLVVLLLADDEPSAHAAMWAIIYLHVDHPEMLEKAKVGLQQINHPEAKQEEK